MRGAWLAFEIGGATFALLVSLSAVAAAEQIRPRAPIGAPGPARLSNADQAKLDAAIAAHRATRAQLTPEERDDLDRLTARVRALLLRGSLGTMWESAKTAVRNAMPGLSASEVGSLAGYAVDGMAAGDPIGSAAGGDSQAQLLDATKQMQEMQMSFNLQYLQLQSQMQNENRSYTVVSNIVKTKHDTVKNSINNVR
jgi:hypothetical protein